MKGNYKFIYAIKINGNFMNGIIYFKTKEEALKRIESEVLDGYNRLKNHIGRNPCHHLNYSINEGVGACVWDNCSDNFDTEYYINYKVSRVRVPV